MTRKKALFLIPAILLVLLAGVLLFRHRTQQKQVEDYATPLLTQANLLSDQIREVTGAKHADLVPALDRLQEAFAAFQAAALDSRHMPLSELRGFEDFQSILGHCQARIRVMCEAARQGQPTVPDEISFLNALDQALGNLAGDLQDESGLRISTPGQCADAIAAFTAAIRTADR